MAGKYQTGTSIGRGGVGEVFKAWDPVLERPVAIKLLHKEDPDTIRRLQQEARAQACVTHPNICKVYEVGELDGRPYIAMQYINGIPLDQAASSLSISEKIQLFMQVVAAIQSAHEAGLIHRDVKPGNILVETNGGAGPVAYVVDFGIARQQSMEGITSTGQVLGTPQYMSPEQASGEIRSLDHRSDIFSLGVVLYELLSGSLPFSGRNVVDLLVQIVNADPIPIRTLSPPVPRDLEIIVSKCMEKNPARRYQSAKDLGDDLKRWLGGETIQARPATMRYRLMVRFRRHPAAAVAGMIAISALIAIVLLYIGGKEFAAEQSRLAERYGQRAEQMQALIRIAYLQPLHNIQPDKARVQNEISILESQLPGQRPETQGPIHYAIGRGWQTIGRLDTARRHLELARSKGFTSPGLLLALGRTLGSLYSQRWSELNRISDEDLHEEELKRTREELAEPAAKLISEVDLTELGLLSHERTFLQAQLALYAGSFLKAKELARATLEQNPWFYEAHLLRAETALQQANESATRGKTIEAYPFLEEAIVELEAARKQASSDPRVYISLCDSYSRLLEFDQNTGKPLEVAYQKAEESCGNALVADPEIVQAFDLRSEVRLRMAQHKIRQGQDAEQLLANAKTDVEHWLALAPNTAQAHGKLGSIYGMEGERIVDLGGIALPQFKAAVDAYRQAVDLDARDANLLLLYGNALINYGQQQSYGGDDPLPAWREAENRLVKITARPVLASRFLTALCAVRIEIGYYLFLRGKDAHAILQEGVDACIEGLQHRPDYLDGLHRLGYAYWSLAEYEAEAGLNPEGSFAKASDAFGSVLKISPNRSGTHVNRSHVLEEQAKWMIRRGEDASAVLEESERHLESFREIYPDEYYFIKAKVELVRAESMIRKGQSPDSAFREADKYSRLSIRGDYAAYPDNVSVAMQVQRQRISWLLQEQPEEKDQVRSLANQALKMSEKALAAEPEHPELLAHCAAIHYMLAAISTKEERQTSIKRAEELKALVLKIRPALARNLEL